jgi:hypothetical protein
MHLQAAVIADFVRFADAAVFTIHTKSVWRSREGLVILLSQFVPLGMLLILFYAFGFATRPEIYRPWGGWLHLIGVWVAALILVFGFIHIAHKRTIRFRHIGPTADKVRTLLCLLFCECISDS